jgi:RNA polymerase sigma-70 factor (ECF subfamily)
MTSPGGPEPFGESDLAIVIAGHREDALRVARRLVRSDAEAEDLTQTAMLNVLRRAEFIEDSTHVKAYLLTTVRNLWRNQLRQQGHRRFVGSDSAELLASPEAGPEEQALTVLDASLARTALDALSQTSREVLLLRYVEGLGFVELAERLAVSPVAARQRAHRAREELISACIELTAHSAADRCSSVRSRLGRYLRGRLSAKARVEIRRHIDCCRSCRECLTQLLDLYGPLLTPSESSHET